MMDLLRRVLYALLHLCSNGCAHPVRALTFDGQWNRDLPVVGGAASATCQRCGTSLVIPASHGGALAVGMIPTPAGGTQ
jgi:hypothetical protein